MMCFSKGCYGWGKKLGHPQAWPPVSALWLFCSWGHESLTKGALGPASPGSDKKVVSGTGPGDLIATVLMTPRYSWVSIPVPTAVHGWVAVPGSHRVVVQSGCLLCCLGHMLCFPGLRASSETSFFPSIVSDHGRGCWEGKGPSHLSGHWQAVTVWYQVGCALIPRLLAVPRFSTDHLGLHGDNWRLALLLLIDLALFCLVSIFTGPGTLPALQILVPMK